MRESNTSVNGSTSPPKLSRLPSKRSNEPFPPDDLNSPLVSTVPHEAKAAVIGKATARRSLVPMVGSDPDSLESAVAPPAVMLLLPVVGNPMPIVLQSKHHYATFPTAYLVLAN